MEYVANLYQGGWAEDDTKVYCFEKDSYIEIDPKVNYECKSSDADESKLLIKYNDEWVSVQGIDFDVNEVGAK